MKCAVCISPSMVVFKTLHSMIHIHTSNDPLLELGEKLSTLFKEYHHKDILLFFSAGSSMALLDTVHPSLVPKHTTVSILDERFTFEKEKSNYSLFSNTTFFKELKKDGIESIDLLPKTSQNLEDCGKRFDLALKKWHVLHPHGKVIAVFGIGTDGHTAGILPYAERPEYFGKLFLKEAQCAIGYETTPEKSPFTKRVTVTASYITRHITHALVYASGSRKKPILERILKNDEPLSKLPANILHTIPDAHLFTDLSL